VIAAAGALEHERLVELVEQAVRPAAGARRGTDPLSELKPRVCFHTKQTEQYHLCLGAPGLARGDERRYVLRVLDTILGGSSSSRLFQEVREKRGLAYSVYSYSSQYLDAGQVAVYVGTRPDRVREAMQVIGDELHKLQDASITAEELERAKENVKGRTVLSMESTLTRMNRLGASVLMDVPLLSLDEIVAAIDAITLDDVQALARELWAPERMSAAGVGGDESTFLGALDAVNPQLVAAA
jgi:predicted Zn-dependent peptidase